MLHAQSRILNTAKNGNILFKFYHYSSAISVQPYQFLKSKNGIENALSLEVKTPLAQSIRWRNPKELKRAKIPHKARALVLELTHEKFKFPLEGLPVSETCINAVKNKYVKKQEESPFERIMAREFLEEVEAGEMLAIAHFHPCKADDLFEQRVQLHRNNMKYLYYPNTIAQLAFTGTKYDGLVPLYSQHTTNIVAYDKDFKKLLMLERRLPSFTILAVVVENRVLSVSELKQAAELPSLPLMRGTLLNTLRAQQQRLTQHLTAHQAELTGSLERYCSRPGEETQTSPEL